MIVAKGHYNAAYDRWDLFVKEDLPNGYIKEWNEILISDIQRGSARKPMIEDCKEFLQACCDAAFEMSIYPRQLADKRDELAAVKDHLKDMRDLVFNHNVENK